MGPNEGVESIPPQLARRFSKTEQRRQDGGVFSSSSSGKLPTDSNRVHVAALQLLHTKNLVTILYYIPKAKGIHQY